MRLIGLALLGILMMSAPALAMQTCVVGQDVLTPGGKRLTVTEVNGSACRTQGKIDGITHDDWWSAFMLEAASEGAIVTSDDRRLFVGKYECWANGNYLFVDLVINNDGSYQDGTGARGEMDYFLDGRIDFGSGPFAGYRGEALDGAVYLTQPGTQSAVQCGYKG